MTTITIDAGRVVVSLEGPGGELQDYGVRRDGDGWVFTRVETGAEYEADAGWCSCPAWKFSPRGYKSCKHTKAAADLARLQSLLRGESRERTVCV